MTTSDTGFTFLTDEEEAAELAAVGINVEPKDASQEQRDAIASYQLRAIGELEQEIAERTRGMENEIALIRARYARLLDPLRARHMEKETYVKILAQISLECGGFGKAKSRKVGYGQYGSRVKKGGLVVTDEQDVGEWAAKSGRLSLFDATVKMEMPRAYELGIAEGSKASLSKTRLNKYFAESGEEIPGTVLEHDTTEYYAKPELLTSNGFNNTTEKQ